MQPHRKHQLTPSQPQRSTTMHSTTTTTSNRPRRRIGRMLLAAAVAACALPASASAAVVEEAADGTLVYRAAAGESNNLSVSDPAGNRALEIRDLTGLTERTGLCSQVSSIRVRCAIGIRLSAARLGDRDDNFAIGVSDPVVVDGGSGRDSYTASNPGLTSRVEFRGGADSDSASYSNADRGVRISNDGVANDGRIGFAGDNIGADVERLTGSGFGDEITAMGDPTVSFPLQSITGGQGNDILRDGPGSVLTFVVMGPVADGADDIIGGPGESRLDSTRRTQPVNVTLNFGGADDGEQGEGDEITGSFEVIGGGSGGDTLRAPAGSTASHHLTGNAGGDTIEGADGPDTLNGGSGVDTIVANGGNDLVQARDNVGDTVGCGLGTDTAELDPNTVDVSSSCENRVGALRLAPKGLRVKAGETARLKLAWSHPRSWRQLRRVALRLYRGKHRVGEVTISPRSRRVEDRGAVRVVRRSSRIARRGKTVSARLGLRLDRSLAGRRLRVEVEAVDVRGARQLEARAGSIRVVR
jgi:hemolysin type calcium-binding protein